MVGGGGGGQRRELNVLKRLRMSGSAVDLVWKYEDLAVWISAEKDESKGLISTQVLTDRLTCAIFSLPL